MYLLQSNLQNSILLLPLAFSMRLNFHFLYLFKTFRLLYIYRNSTFSSVYSKEANVISLWIQPENVCKAARLEQKVV